MVRTTVKKNTWGIDDEYLIIEVQVDSSEFKAGETVNVIIEKVNE